MKNKINMNDDIWKTIFDIIKNNRARNIHATIIDFPILSQNLTLVMEKLLDYSDDRIKDMSLMKYMVSGTADKMICCEISLTGFIVAVGFEDGLIKVFKCKIGNPNKQKRQPDFDAPSSERSQEPKESRENIDKLIGHQGAVY